jgi:hypothetical protein
VGELGNVMLFLFMLAGSVLVGALVLAYAARCVVVVVEGTAAGHDRVVWPDEPLADWVLGAIRLGALVVLWLAPAGFLSHALRHDFKPDDPGLRFLLLAVPGLWLIFPVGVLSALSSTSGWAPVRLTILAQLLRLFPATLGFYALSLLVLAVPTVLWYVTLFTAAAYVLPLAAVGTAAALLIYARLLGRLAWLIHQLKPLPTRPGKRLPAAKASQKPARRSSRRWPAPTEDPWAVPEDESDPEPEPPPARRPKGVIPRSPDEVEGYGLAADQPAEPAPEEKHPEPPRRPRGPIPRSPDEVEGYGVAAEEPAALPSGGPHPTFREDREAISSAPRPAPEKQSREKGEEEFGRELAQYEERLLARGPTEPIPSLPLFSGVYTFPWYQSSLGPWVWLSAGSLVFGLLLRGLVSFWPGG